MPKTTYVWDELSDNVIEEYEDGVLSVSYTHEPGLYGNLLSQNRNGVNSYYHYDGRGDTVALTDESGNVTDTKEYDAWGNVIASTGSTVTPYTMLGARSVYSHQQLRLSLFKGYFYSAVTGTVLTTQGRDRFITALMFQTRPKADPQLTVNIKAFPSINCREHRIEITPSLESSKEWLESHPTQQTPHPTIPNTNIVDTRIWAFQYLNFVSVNDGCCPSESGCRKDAKADRCRSEFYELLGGKQLSFMGCNTKDRCFWSMGLDSTDVHINAWHDEAICRDKDCGKVIALVQMRFFVEGFTKDRRGYETKTLFEPWPTTSIFDSCTNSRARGHLTTSRPAWWDQAVPLASAFYRYELESCCCDQSYKNARVISIQGPVTRKPDWWRE